MTTTAEILVADEAWIALALLQRSHPERTGFSAREILDRLKRERIHPDVRAGVSAHVYLHNVANLPPNSAKYRLFYRLPDGTYRLFRPGDDRDPARTGKTSPRRSDLPSEYHELLDWYEREYCRDPGPPAEDTDVILMMRGVGKEIWKDEGGDAFVARERAGWDQHEREAAVEPHASVAGSASLARPEPLSQRVWSRIVEHEGQVFHTKKCLPFTYKVEGDRGIWFYREGKRINKRLSRGDVEKAVERCPLDKVTDIRDCFDPAYLYAVLMDRRIRDKDW